MLRISNHLANNPEGVRSEKWENISWFLEIECSKLFWKTINVLIKVSSVFFVCLWNNMSDLGNVSYSVLAFHLFSTSDALHQPVLLCPGMSGVLISCALSLHLAIQRIHTLNSVGQIQSRNTNKFAKLRRHSSRVHFAPNSFGPIHFV